MDELLKFGWLAICAGAGGFLGSYLKRKGENLATHEDIGRLVDQVRAVTKATKEIEAKISDDVWDRQKRWELKREVLFETMKKLALVRERLAATAAAHQTEKKWIQQGSAADSGFAMKENTEFCEAADDLDQMTLLVGLVCGKELGDHLRRFIIFYRPVAGKILSGEPEAFDTSLAELSERVQGITDAMRKEMGIERTS
jgi:hypothetical protein